MFLERVGEAQRIASRELRELQDQDPKKKKRKGNQLKDGKDAGEEVGDSGGKAHRKGGKKQRK